MPSYVLVKNGERVRADSNAKRDALLAQGYTVETNAENDPRDLEAAVGVNRTKSTFKLPVLASAPAGPNVVGEVYIATGGVLKICTVAGSPGTWVSVGAQT